MHAVKAVNCLDRLKKTHRPPINITRVRSVWLAKNTDVVFIITIEEAAPIMRNIADTMIKSGGIKKTIMISLP